MATAPDLSAVDARRDQRYVTVLMVGKVRGSRGEYPCVISDVSQRGLRARFPHPPTVGERITVSLRGQSERAATVRWVEGYRGGVEFDAAIEVAAILGGEASDPPPRAPRFDCGLAATLLLGEQRRPIELIDVSLGGAKLDIAGPLPADAIGRWATLVLPQTNVRRAGVICWSQDGRAGFRFALSLPIDVLAGLLARGGR